MGFLLKFWLIVQNCAASWKNLIRHVIMTETIWRINLGALVQNKNKMCCNDTCKNHLYYLYIFQTKNQDIFVTTRSSGNDTELLLLHLPQLVLLLHLLHSRDQPTVCTEQKLKVKRLHILFWWPFIFDSCVSLNVWMLWFSQIMVFPILLVTVWTVTRRTWTWKSQREGWDWQEEQDRGAPSPSSEKGHLFHLPHLPSLRMHSFSTACFLVTPAKGICKIPQPQTYFSSEHGYAQFGTFE